MKRTLWGLCLLAACGEVDNQLPDESPSLTLNQGYMDQTSQDLQELKQAQEDISKRLEDLQRLLNQEEINRKEAQEELKALQFLQSLNSLQLVNPCVGDEKYYVQLSAQLAASPMPVLRKDADQVFEQYIGTFLIPGYYRYNSCEFELKEVALNLEDWQRKALQTDRYEIPMMEICWGDDLASCTTAIGGS